MCRWVVCLLLLGIGGCGSKGSPAASTDRGEGPEITVFAAASLTEAFTGASRAVPQVRLRFSFAGSQQLVTQLTQGAPADAVATADESSMQRLVDSHLVDPPATLAHTTLVIAVAPGNPKALTGLADLVRPGLAVVLADPSVPAGRYAKQVLTTAGVSVSPRSLELDVKATLAKVESGAADAALVYATDVRGSGGKAAAVPFPEASDPAVSVTYRIAVVAGTHHRTEAEAFVTSARTGPVHQALLDAGFTA